MTKQARAIQILEIATDLVEKGWIKNCYAMDDENNECSQYLDEACKFCALGALDCATDKVNGNIQLVPVQMLAQAIMDGNLSRSYLVRHKADWTGIADWNDDPDTTHSDVVTAFQAAVELAKIASADSP